MLVGSVSLTKRLQSLFPSSYTRQVSSPQRRGRPLSEIYALKYSELFTKAYAETSICLPVMMYEPVGLRWSVVPGVSWWIISSNSLQESEEHEDQRIGTVNTF